MKDLTGVVAGLGSLGRRAGGCLPGILTRTKLPFTMPFTYFACRREGTETCLEASNTRRSSCGGLKRDFNKRVAKVLFIFKYGTIPSGRWKRKVEGGRRDGDAVEGENE